VTATQKRTRPRNKVSVSRPLRRRDAPRVCSGSFLLRPEDSREGPVQRRRVRPTRWDGRPLRSRRRVSRQPLAHERKRARPRRTTAYRGTGPGWPHPTRGPRVDRSDRSQTRDARQDARRPRRKNESDIPSSSRGEERVSHQIELLGTRLRAAIPSLGHVRRHRASGSRRAIRVAGRECNNAIECVAARRGRCAGEAHDRAL